MQTMPKDHKTELKIVVYTDMFGRACFGLTHDPVELLVDLVAAGVLTSATATKAIVYEAVLDPEVDRFTFNKRLAWVRLLERFRAATPERLAHAVRGKEITEAQMQDIITDRAKRWPFDAQEEESAE